jgi:hypothetical protein
MRTVVLSTPPATGSRRGGRRRFGRQFAQQLGREAGQAAVRRARHQVQACFAIEGQHRGAWLGVARQRILHAARRIAEQRHRQHRVGAGDPLAYLAFAGSHQLGRCA